MDEFKKIIFPILGVIVFICAVGLLYKKAPNFSSAPTLKQGTVKINNVSIKVEEATTPAEREKGLSGRSGLEKGTGMLFVLDKTSSIPTFWMKEMKFAIDIVWIKDNKIVQIDKNILPPEANTADNQLKRFSPKVPVDYVLETNAGFCDQNKIKVGDSVQMQFDQ